MEPDGARFPRRGGARVSGRVPEPRTVDRRVRRAGRESPRWTTSTPSIRSRSSSSSSPTSCGRRCDPRRKRLRPRPHFRVFPGEGAHSEGLASFVTKLDAIGYIGDYSFDVYNDDYLQIPPEAVAGGRGTPPTGSGKPSCGARCPSPTWNDCNAGHTSDADPAGAGFRPRPKLCPTRSDRMAIDQPGWRSRRKALRSVSAR